MHTVLKKVLQAFQFADLCKQTLNPITVSAEFHQYFNFIWQNAPYYCKIRQHFVNKDDNGTEKVRGNCVEDDIIKSLKHK